VQPDDDSDTDVKGKLKESIVGAEEPYRGGGFSWRVAGPGRIPRNVLEVLQENIGELVEVGRGQFHRPCLNVVSPGPATRGFGLWRFWRFWRGKLELQIGALNTCTWLLLLPPSMMSRSIMSSWARES